jgi:hypothetical protein
LPPQADLVLELSNPVDMEILQQVAADLGLDIRDVVDLDMEL